MIDDAAINSAAARARLKIEGLTPFHVPYVQYYLASLILWLVDGDHFGEGCHRTKIIPDSLLRSWPMCTQITEPRAGHSIGWFLY